MADPRQGESVLVCIPTYNEAENLGLVVPAVLAALPAAHVLVVDDDSPDGTGRLADQMAQDDPRIHVLHRKAKEGLGKAYLEAFAWALARGYGYVFEFDADLSHDPSCLPRFAAALADDADVVVGSRRIRGGGVKDWGRLRRFVSWGGSLYSRLVLGVPIRDLTGGFNGFRRQTLLGLGLGDVTSTGYCFQIELKYRAMRRGFRMVEGPIVFPDRVHGSSKMSGPIVLEAIVQVWKLRFRAAAIGPGGPWRYKQLPPARS